MIESNLKIRVELFLTTIIRRHGMAKLVGAVVVVMLIIRWPAIAVIDTLVAAADAGGTWCTLLA